MASEESKTQQHVVMLCGHRYSGKDTAGRLLVEHAGFARMALADALRDVALEICQLFFPDAGLTPETFTTYKDIEWSLPGKCRTPRAFLIELGTPIMRHRYADIWARCLVERIKASGLPRIVVTDYRMPNENAVLTSAFPSIRRIRMSRDSVVPSDEERAKRGETEAHVEALPVDGVVVNPEGDSDSMLPNLLTQAGMKGLVVTGSREWREEAAMRRRLFPDGYTPVTTILFHGACRGADLMAARLGRDAGCHVVAVPVDHTVDGSWPAAGPRRNARMLGMAGALFSRVQVRGFPTKGSKGTKDCLTQARMRDFPCAAVGCSDPALMEALTRIGVLFCA